MGQKLGLKYPLLADTQRTMTRAYGTLNEDPALANNPKTIAGYLRSRAVVMVVDKNGVIRYKRDTQPRGDIPIEEVLAAVEKMK